MKRSIFLIASMWVFVLHVAAQDTAFARKTMQTLCNQYYGGRGYVDSGDHRAAQYIRQQFKQIGLKPGGKNNSYYQNFKFNVNTFPGKTEIILDGKNGRKTLIPGADFLLAPHSGGGVTKELKLVVADSALLSKILNGKFKKPRGNFALVIDGTDLKKAKKEDALLKLFSTEAKAIIELKTEKLLWSVSDFALPIPYIELAKNAFDGADFISYDIENKLIEDHPAQNVIGLYKSPKNPDSFIVFSAHYDHLGKMGNQAYFPGANDNASGVAFMLDLAKSYVSGKDTPKYSIAFIAFAGEEAGLVGSKYYTENPLIPLNKIKFLINMDLMGNGQDGLMAVNGSVFTDEYNKLVEINTKNSYLKEIKARGKAANSDHYWFTEKGVKAFFIYLLGDYPQYHDIYDTPEKPTLKGYEGAFKLVREFVSKL